MLANVAASAESLVVECCKVAKALFGNALEYPLRSSDLALLAVDIKA